MSEIMLHGVLNMPLPDDPEKLDCVTFIQFKDRARQASQRILELEGERDAALAAQAALIEKAAKAYSELVNQWSDPFKDEDGTDKTWASFISASLKALGESLICPADAAEALAAHDARLNEEIEALNKTVADLMSQVSTARREALEEAAEVIGDYCAFTKYGQEPLTAEMVQDIRALIDKE